MISGPVSPPDQEEEESKEEEEVGEGEGEQLSQLFSMCPLSPHRVVFVGM